MTEYSYTRLTTWEECHYSYYLKYIDDNKPEKADNAFAQYGHLCHTLIDEWAQGLIDDSVLWFEYEERYPDFVTAPYPAFMKKVQEKAYDDGLKYFESFNGFPGYEIIATEKAYHTTLNGYKFTGIIDMIMKDKETGELIILDHKSKTLDTYKKEEVESLKVGDVLVFCDGEHTISNIGKSPMDTLELQFEDGEEILLDENEDGTFSARMSTDDMECMHIQDEWNLKPAADIVLIDRSYIEKDEPVTVNGLEAILKLQAQREEGSIGFDYTVTTIELNENSEIAVIHVAYAPWQ